MNLHFRQMPVLVVASALAVIGLVVFQLSWMRYSRELSEEIFNQRACMALCSTVENYDNGALCCQGESSLSCQSQSPDEINFGIHTNLPKDTDFHSELRRSLDFYQIQLDYNLSISDKEKPDSARALNQCAVALPSVDGAETAYLHLDFPEKKAFVLGKMNFMVVATVLILLFTVAVLLFANWLLHKQKRLLQTNVDFFNNMAHEFRTPLTNMGLAANLFSKKHPELKDQKLLDIIRQENSKMLNQVERVLHLASLENGDYALQKEQLNLRKFLQGVVDDMAMQIQERDARVELKTVHETLEIYGDRLHLGNVFRNLLDNALKYGGHHPEITITAEEQQKGILIAVQDSGAGIPSSQRELIFEKFQRVSQGDLHEKKGFGLGLAYVKSMVELHKGFVRVSSEENRGSRFEVYLPALV